MLEYTGGITEHMRYGNNVVPLTCASDDVVTCVSGPIDRALEDRHSRKLALDDYMMLSDAMVVKDGLDRCTDASDEDPG